MNITRNLTESLNNKYNLKESAVEEWWGQTDDDPYEVGNDYDLAVEEIESNGDETLYRFEGQKENIERAMDDGYFYSVEYGDGKFEESVEMNETLPPHPGAVAMDTMRERMMDDTAALDAVVRAMDDDTALDLAEYIMRVYELEDEYDLDEGLELTEARNSENDEINALIRKNLGKKNISKKDMQALTDAGITVYPDGDMRGPNGRLLQKGLGRVYGPSQTVYKYNKHDSPFGPNRNGDRTTTYWNLRKNGRGFSARNADKFDEVDLKNYLDKPARSTEWEREQEINKSLRPYSDDYKRAKDNKDFHDRVAGEYSADVMSDEEIESKVQEYKDRLIRLRDSAKSNSAYNNKESQEYQQIIDDAKARAKARHPQYESLNEAQLNENPVLGAVVRAAGGALLDKVNAKLNEGDCCEDPITESIYDEIKDLL